jgi:hypothetical protein
VTSIRAPPSRSTVAALSTALYAWRPKG